MTPPDRDGGSQNTALAAHGRTNCSGKAFARQETHAPMPCWLTKFSLFSSLFILRAEFELTPKACIDIFRSEWFRRYQRKKPQNFGSIANLRKELDYLEKQINMPASFLWGPP